MSNVLNREITQTLLKNKESFSLLKERWNKAVAEYKVDTNSYNITPTGILYAVLRGKDWMEGFTEVTNSVKLENGANPWHARAMNLSYLRNNFKFYAEPFADLLSNDAEKIIKDLLPAWDCGIAYNIKEKVS